VSVGGQSGELDAGNLAAKAAGRTAINAPVNPAASTSRFHSRAEGTVVYLADAGDLLCTDGRCTSGAGNSGGLKVEERIGSLRPAAASPIRIANNSFVDDARVRASPSMSESGSGFSAKSMSDSNLLSMLAAGLGLMGFVAGRRS
jgi:hypothetical protein